MKNVKKVLSFAVAAALTASMFAGCNVSVKKDDAAKASASPAATSNTTDSSWNDIKAKGKFVVGLDDQFPPMGFRDDTNEIVGADIDLAKAVAEKLGIQVEFKSIDWKTKEMELDTKKIDVIWNGFSISEERKQSVLFSKAYMDNTQAIVVKEGSGIKAKSDLAGKKIGVQGGSSAVEAMEADSIYSSIGKEKVSTYDTIPLALLDLASGRIDAVVADEVVVRYNITKSKEKYSVLKDNFGAEEYGVGFRKTDVSFKDKVDEALSKIKADGTAEKISKKWFGEDAGNKIK